MCRCIDRSIDRYMSAGALAHRSLCGTLSGMWEGRKESTRLQRSGEEIYMYVYVCVFV